jgi:transcription elongation factor Elf1
MRFTCPNCTEDIELTPLMAWGGPSGVYQCPDCGEKFNPDETHLSQVPDNADAWDDIY